MRCTSVRPRRCSAPTRTDNPDLTAQDAADLSGERLVGLAPDQLAIELGDAGASPAAVSALPHTGVGTVPPAELVGQGLQNAVPTEATVAAGMEIEESPEVG